MIEEERRKGQQLLEAEQVTTGREKERDKAQQEVERVIEEEGREAQQLLETELVSAGSDREKGRDKAQQDVKR